MKALTVVSIMFVAAVIFSAVGFALYFWAVYLLALARWEAVLG